MLVPVQKKSAPSAEEYEDVTKLSFSSNSPEADSKLKQRPAKASDDWADEDFAKPKPLEEKAESFEMLKLQDYLAHQAKLEKERQCQPSPSLQSVRSLDFYGFDLPSSTPVPFDVKEQFEDPFEEPQASSLDLDVDETTEVDATFKNEMIRSFIEYSNTPEVVTSTNPFKPALSLMRLPLDDVYEILNESLTDNEADENTIHYEPISSSESSAEDSAEDLQGYEQIDDDLSSFDDDLPDLTSRKSFHSVPSSDAGNASSSMKAEEDNASLQKIKLEEAQNELEISFEPQSVLLIRQTEDIQENSLNMSTHIDNLIAELPIDDPLFLTTFEPVIRDPTLKLSFQVIPQQEIKIHISEVFSPIHFWFHYEYEIETVMEMLKEDYNELNDRQLVISDSNIKAGLLVACYLPEFQQWHRAMVIKPIDKQGQIRLLFVDYGTVGMVKSKQIKFLYEKYLLYPRYGIRGRFVNLKPPNMERMWNESQTNKLLLKISNKELNAIVKRFDEAEQVYELDISWNSAKGPEIVRDWLVLHCLAEGFVMQPNSMYPSCYYFPSFDMLEKNYPTFHEMSMLIADGIDYNLLVETNFLSCVGDNVLTTTPNLLRLLGHSKFSHYRNYFFPGF